VKKTAKSNALQVCLLSSHSLALSELQRVLKNPAYHLIPRQLESAIGSELRQLKVPRANVYVVDAHFMRPAVNDLLSNILDQFPEARIIVVSGKFEPADSYSFLHMGAKGLLTFDEAREQLARALPLVSKGGYWVPRAVLSGFVESILQGTLSLRLKVDPSTNITSRQQEVLDGLLQQLSNKEVGSKLNISMRTVKFHVSNILSKFGVRRRSDLILLCSQRSSATPDPMARAPKRNGSKAFSGDHATN
jgi:DNA-binding NarL/FixJ family response regulator